VEIVTLVVAASLGLGIIFSVVNHDRNRLFTKAVPVFRASRWTKGNRIWPAQVAVFPTRVVRYKMQPFGQFQEAIGIDQVATVSVHPRRFFGDVIISTIGGSQPIHCHGHRRRDAEAIRRRITEAQARQPRSTVTPRRVSS
jgi:hypothetical protein